MTLQGSLKTTNWKWWNVYTSARFLLTVGHCFGSWNAHKKCIHGTWRIDMMKAILLSWSFNDNVSPSALAGLPLELHLPSWFATCAKVSAIAILSSGLLLPSYFPIWTMCEQVVVQQKKYFFLVILIPCPRITPCNQPYWRNFNLYDIYWYKVKKWHVLPGQGNPPMLYAFCRTQHLHQWDKFTLHESATSSGKIYLGIFGTAIPVWVKISVTIFFIFSNSSCDSKSKSNLPARNSGERTRDKGSGWGMAQRVTWYILWCFNRWHPRKCWEH